MARVERTELPALLLAAAVTALVTWGYRAAGISNSAIVVLTYLMIVLAGATLSSLRVAIVLAVATTVCLNFFFLPPVGTLTIADPQNWVALFVFLSVGLVASNLSSTARRRTDEATAAAGGAGAALRFDARHPARSRRAGTRSIMWRGSSRSGFASIRPSFACRGRAGGSSMARDLAGQPEVIGSITRLPPRAPRSCSTRRRGRMAGTM